MNDLEFRQRLKDTKFVVEANGFETLALWEKHSSQSDFKSPTYNIPKFHIEQVNPGWALTIGELAYKPVVMSVSWWKIDGVLIMFYDMVSRMVDYQMKDDWLSKNCDPKDLDGRPANCNAMNFHNVIHYIQRSKERR